MEVRGACRKESYRSCQSQHSIATSGRLTLRHCCWNSLGALPLMACSPLLGIIFVVCEGVSKETGMRIQKFGNAPRPRRLKVDRVSQDFLHYSTRHRSYMAMR